MELGARGAREPQPGAARPEGGPRATWRAPARPVRGGTDTGPAGAGISSRRVAVKLARLAKGAVQRHEGRAAGGGELELAVKPHGHTWTNSSKEAAAKPGLVAGKSMIQRSHEVSAAIF